ncbi:YggS family pyridoxal phosphate-dependent enzyme [Nesterenkonia sp.]|uniref:YggS family pyridoxal phosphate-dependent enzyme n=1 Tax=Nesterenkonia sp. TaxID=704201 RepID=UPI002615E401|nr:YggS family pyridoxal phosphate-dependent enzyme [Nesterenkonia sp.]
MDSRTEQLQQNLAAVVERIQRACESAGRTEQPELIVVTKYFPAADVRRLHSLGVTQLGENKDQEAAEKAAETADLQLDWHFIGQLQSNKAKSVARYASAVHSVDRLKLVGALEKAVTRAQAEGHRSGELDCLVQVDLRTPTPEDARGGAAPGQVPAIAEAIAAADGLHLAGLMAVAPLEENPEAAFQRLVELSEQLRTEHPEATALSAGMSQDLEQAVACGATHLRIGRDVLGERPYAR